MTLRLPLLFGVAAMAATIVSEELAILVLAAIVWTGLVLAARLRPSISEAASLRRLPNRSEAAALAVGLIGSGLTFSAIAGLGEFVMALMRPRSLEVAGVLGPIFVLILMSLPVGPLWRRIATGEAAETSLRPLVSALLGLGPLGAGLGIVWLSAIEPFARPIVSDAAGLNAVMVAPLWCLLLTFGMGSILPAFRGEPEAGVVFRWTATAVLVAWALVGFVLTLGLDVLGGPFSPMTALRGGQWSAAYGAATALAWCCALWRVRKTPVEGTFAVLATAVFLIVAFPVSLWVSGGVMQNEWTDFIAVVLFPFALITDIAVLLAVPAVIGLVARLRPRAGLAPSAGLS